MRTLVVFVVLSFAEAANRIEYAPHHVDLLILSGQNGKIPGSGVLVSLKQVLTVGTNIFGFDEWHIRYGNQEFGHGTLRSQNVILHPDYDATTTSHNLGIIILPRSLLISPATMPVALPSPDSNLPNPGDFGFIATYHGKLFSKNNKITCGPQTAVENERCEDILKLLDREEPYFCVSQELFKVCGGSQGAGFVVSDDGQRVLVGLMAYGNIWGDCNGSDYIVYIQLAPYVNWIRRNLLHSI